MIKALGLVLLVAVGAQRRAPRAPRPLKVPAPTASGSSAPVQPEPPDAPPRALAVSRVELIQKRGQILVITDLSFEKTDRPRDWELFLAYGAPGMPRAFEAELVPVAPDALFARAEAHGAPLVTTHVPAAPSDAEAAIGPREAAGQVVRIPREPGTGRFFVIRVRALHAIPARAVEPSVLVRISHDGSTLPLGPLFVRRDDPKTVAVANLCGGPRLAIVGEPGGTSPLVAPRQPADELCVRFVKPSAP